MSPWRRLEGMDGSLRKTGSEVIRGCIDRKNVVALVDQGVVSIANFLTGLIVGRICSKEQFGLYMLGFTVVTMSMSLQDSLILTPYTIYSPRLKGRELSRYAGGTFVHQVFFSIGVVLLLLGFCVAVPFGIGPPDFAPVAKALLFAAGFVLLRNYARRVSFAALKMGEALVLDTVVSILQVGGLFVLFRYGILSASSAYWATGAACAAGGLSWMAARRGGWSLGDAAPVSALRQNVSTGLWILASGLLWTTVISVYPWLLAAFHGTAAAGVWAACFGMIAFCNPLFLAMQNSFSPKIAHAFADGTADAFRRYSLRTTSIFGVVLAPFCVVLFFFGGDLVPVVYGGKYAGNGPVVSLLALDFFFSALTFPLSRALFTAGRADVDFKINLVMVLCLLAFGIWIVRSFGPVGAASSLVVTDGICFSIRYAAFRRLSREAAGAQVPGPKAGRVPVADTKVAAE